MAILAFQGEVKTRMVSSAVKKNVEYFIDDTFDLMRRVYRFVKQPVFRVHLMRLIAVGLTALLLIGVYMVQITHAEEYQAFYNITTTANLRREVTRGEIFDRFGNPLVVNEAVEVITYRHIPNTPFGHMRQVAQNLALLIDVDDSGLTPRDLRDLFIFYYLEDARALVPAEKQSSDSAVFNQQMIDAIEDEHLTRLTPLQLRTHVIFLRMNQGGGMTTNLIKERPTEEEVARVIENLSYLPGVEVGMDWVRSYPSGVNSALFGSVSTRQTGVPLDRQAYFLTQGYAPNARVGTSQLERSLQTYLSGFQYRYFIDDGVETQLTKGMPGYHVSLNLDATFQLMVEEIVSEHLLDLRENSDFARYLQRSYAVVMNPQTGAVYAMVGVLLLEDEETGELEAHMRPLETIMVGNLVGSAVKGASLATGFAYQTTQSGQVRLDNVLRFQGTPPLRSWTPMGNVNDITAIYRSSNVYFYRQAMEMAGIFNDSPNAAVVGWDFIAWEQHYRMFRQFGLGTHTGIELISEETGHPGHRTFDALLRYSIGQEATYTAMQLAQFGSTIATRGRRMQAQLVQNIYMPSPDGQTLQLVRPFAPNMLNQVVLSEEHWDRIQEGHRRAVTQGPPNGGTAFALMQGVSFNPAGKTGTAEDFLRRHEDGTILFNEQGEEIMVLNHSFFAYAPYDEPEIVVAVIVPAAQVLGSQGVPSQAVIITREIMEAYFDLQLVRAGGPFETGDDLESED